MKHVKRILAFALTLFMAFGFTPVAFADAGDLTVDEKITVTGFKEGDVVTAYQFITWVNGEGWSLPAGILVNEGEEDQYEIKLANITDGLTKDELAALAKNTDKMTQVTGTTKDATWERTCGTVETAGSYLILVKSNNVEFIYNPAVVSADFNGTNPTTVELTDDQATIKKQSITVDKKADKAPDDYDVQVDDIVPFTVSVTVPQYNDNWTEPTFKVTDKLSTGLTIEKVPTIEGLTAGTDYTLTKGAKGDDGFTIEFSENYLKTKPSTAVEIKYSAKVGEAVKDTKQVHEETNKVTLQFSNDPTNEGSHKTIDDETHHYTFAIDANRLGQGSDKTNELIKVGVDADGNPLTKYKEGVAIPTGVSPLAGAEFTLTGTGANNQGTVTLTATSEADGHISFNNLEVGTYKLKETKAPAGYIKDQTEHDVVIAAEYNEDTTLKSYTITIDGQATSTYTATTNAENPTTYEAPSGGNDVFPINNKQGTELPSTGGIGTTIFYIVGGVMVAGAVIFLLTKRRVTAE